MHTIYHNTLYTTVYTILHEQQPLNPPDSNTSPHHRGRGNTDKKTEANPHPQRGGGRVQYMPTKDSECQSSEEAGLRGSPVWVLGWGIINSSWLIIPTIHQTLSDHDHPLQGGLSDTAPYVLVLMFVMRKVSFPTGLLPFHSWSRRPQTQRATTRSQRRTSPPIGCSWWQTVRHGYIPPCRFLVINVCCKRRVEKQANKNSIATDQI